MNAFFELRHTQDPHFEIGRNREYTFPPHFHESVEIIAVKKGCVDVVCNGVSYTLSDGDIAFFDSFDIHAYPFREPIPNSDNALFIIPIEYLSEFTAFKGERNIARPIIHDPLLASVLLELADRVFLKKPSERVQKATAELLLTLLSEKLTFIDGFEDETSLIRQILSFIQERFKDDLSLSAIAEKFGYTTAHVSRTFHRYVKTGLPRYINRLRLDFIDAELKTGKKRKITDLIFEAGFKSIQTYYRAKAERENG